MKRDDTQPVVENYAQYGVYYTTYDPYPSEVEAAAAKDDMEKREIENAKDEVREPVAYSGFPNGMTHVQQVNECLG